MYGILKDRRGTGIKIFLTSLGIAQKYPHFLKNINAQWEKRTFWAHCYKRSTITRGNHTNNAEAGIRILKDLVFVRVKAYNLVQMFYFLVEIMDLYYKRKLVNIANSRLQSYVALRFKGLDAKKVKKEDITKDIQPGWYTVQSQSQIDQSYQVNVHIGVCTCTKGRLTMYSPGCSRCQLWR